MRLTRIHPETGEEFEPHLYQDGMYRVSDPSSGAERHHAENQQAVATLKEVIHFVRKGWGLRMSSRSSPAPSLIASQNIVIAE